MSGERPGRGSARWAGRYQKTGHPKSQTQTWLAWLGGTHTLPTPQPPPPCTHRHTHTDHLGATWESDLVKYIKKNCNFVLFRTTSIQNRSPTPPVMMSVTMMMDMVVGTSVSLCVACGQRGRAGGPHLNAPCLMNCSFRAKKEHEEHGFLHHPHHLLGCPGQPLLTLPWWPQPLSDGETHGGGGGGAAECPRSTPRWRWDSGAEGGVSRG